MNEFKELSCLHKRTLLNQTPVSSERLISHGQTYEAAGLVHDAVDFYERAGALDQLEALLESVKQDGDAFLFRRICRVLGREAAADEWLDLAARAEALGKDAFAQTVYRETGLTPEQVRPGS